MFISFWLIIPFLLALVVLVFVGMLLVVRSASRTMQMVGRFLWN